MDDPANIRRVFGENLQKLIPTKGSVASVALDLGLNRTQLNRYIRSEAFPRPDVLSQICDYFGVDARIFNTPLLSENKPVIMPSGNPVIPPSTDSLPDGIYVEWTGSPDKIDRKFLHLIQISRCDGLCCVHLYARPSDVFEMENTRRITVRRRELLRECVGFAFSQGHCIGMIDGLKGRGTMAFTTYFEGHFGNMDLFLGSKTTGLNNRGANNYNSRPCVLQKIPQTTASVLEWARSPQVFDAEDVPLGITAAFNHMLRFRSQA